MSWIGDVAPCLAKAPEPHRGLPPSLNAWIPELMDLSEMPGLAAAQELARGILGGAAQAGPAQKSAHHRRSSGNDNSRSKAYSEFDPRHKLHARDVWKVESYTKQHQDRLKTVKAGDFERLKWQRQVNSAQIHRGRLQHMDDRLWTNTSVKSCTTSEKMSAKFGPSAQCSGRMHGPEYRCYLCMSDADDGKDHVRLTRETKMYTGRGRMFAKDGPLSDYELIKIEQETKLKTVDRFSTPEKVAHLQAQLEARRSGLQKLEKRPGPSANLRKLWSTWDEQDQEEDDE